MQVQLNEPAEFMQVASVEQLSRSRVHSSMSPHTRSLVAVGATVCSYPDPQTVSAVQVRSLVAVGATDWYWLAVHTVSAEQVRSVVVVGAAVWYWFALQTVAGVQVTVPVDDA